MKAIAGLLGMLLVCAAPAAADVGLLVRTATAVPGERLTVYGPCGRMPVYLVRGSSPRGTTFLARPPGSPYRFLGRMRCTGRVHFVGDFPDGDWSSWTGFLRFRVPDVRPGRYRLLIFCAPCRRGPGGSLIDSTHLWRGNTRIGVVGLRVLPRA